MNYETAVKRLNQFDIINKYSLQMLKDVCNEYNLKIVHVGEVNVTKMGKTGIFALTHDHEDATKYVEVSFWYEDTTDGDISWHPQCPQINMY